MAGYSEQMGMESAEALLPADMESVRALQLIGNRISQIYYHAMAFGDIASDAMRLYWQRVLDNDYPYSIGGVILGAPDNENRRIVWSETPIDDTTGLPHAIHPAFVSELGHGEKALALFDISAVPGGVHQVTVASVPGRIRHALDLALAFEWLTDGQANTRIQALDPGTGDRRTILGENGAH